MFQVEKIFARVKYMDDIDVDKLEAFFEAAEDYNSAMNMSNSMAFISQFGVGQNCGYSIRCVQIDMMDFWLLFFSFN